MIRRVSETDSRPRPWLYRRTVLRALGWLIVAPLPLALASVVRRNEAVTRRARRVVLPAPGPDATLVHDEVIVCRSGEEVRVFAARCTHLGCRIAAVSDGQLACPCHGSRFRLDGSVAQGPASRPLERLDHEVDPKTGALIVHVT